MPQYIGLARIDWHVDDAPPELRAVIADGDAALDNLNHTFTTFRDKLVEIATAHRDLVVDALIDDGFGRYHLLRARSGAVTTTEVVERPAGAPYDSVATVTLVRDRDAIAELIDVDDDELDVPTRYDSEDSMRAVVTAVAGAIDDGGGAFVALADDRRFAVELSPGTVQVTPLEVVTEPALVARLLARDYTTAPVKHTPREPDRKYEQALYWPGAMLELIQDVAARTDRTLSYIVQVAYKHARAQIAAADREALSGRIPASLRDGDKHKQTLYFPGAMLDAMVADAARLDSSLSFVAQVAVALAQDQLAALPTTE